MGTKDHACESNPRHRDNKLFVRLSGGGAGTGGVCEDGGIGVGAIEAIATETHRHPLVTIDRVSVDPSIHLSWDVLTSFRMISTEFTRDGQLEIRDFAK